MKPIIREHGLTHNSCFILQEAREHLDVANFHRFCRQPREWPAFIQGCIDKLKGRGEYYAHTSNERWLQAMINQMQYWHTQQPVDDSRSSALQASECCGPISDVSYQGPTAYTNPLPLTPEPKHMQKYSAVPVAQPTLVFGTDVTELNAQACIATIKSNNAQIKDLVETDIDSPYITKQVEGLNAANAALVARLDSLA